MKAKSRAVCICAGVIALSCLWPPAFASSLILLTGVTPDSREGDLAVVQEGRPNGCRYVGTIHETAHTASSFIEKALVAGRHVDITDLSIELTRRSCKNGETATVDILIPLSTSHSYLDIETDRLRPGYTPGDTVVAQADVKSPAP